MNTPSYYDDPAKAAAFRAAAAALVGTPFFANSEAPGPDGGIDCVHALHWLYRTTGAVAPIAIPPQVMDWGLHSDRSLLIEAFDTWPALTARFACVWRRTVEPAEAPLTELCASLRVGDALCFLQGKAPHHGGASVGDGEILHTLASTGAHRMRLNAVFRGWRVLGYLAAVYRPLPLVA